MIWRSCSRLSATRLAAMAAAALVLLTVAQPGIAAAQGAAQTGSVAGKVTDDKGAPVAGAQVGIAGTTVGAQSSATVAKRRFISAGRTAESATRLPVFLEVKTAFLI